jgi:hypothetical protein
MIYSEEKKFFELKSKMNAILMKSTGLKDCANNEIFNEDIVQDVRSGSADRSGEVRNFLNGDLEVILLEGEVVYWPPKAVRIIKNKYHG